MKRYQSTLIHKAGDYPHALMTEDAEGDYVSYEDAIAAVLAERNRCADIAFGFTSSVHIAHDMKAGIFPVRSDGRNVIAAMIRGEA